MTTNTEKNELISMRGMGVKRDGRWLVSDVDLSISRGEIVTIIGPNGSGKSTTAKVATGVTRASVGEISRKENLKIGYVPQKLTIDWTFPLTVRRLMTLTGKFSPKAIETALAAVGAGHLADASVQTLSGGEFQRVLLARAMIRTPDLLVLDEPVQGVDFAGEVALYDLIKDIRNETGCGILLISHDLHVVMAATDTVVCLNGHVCCTGSPEVVAQSPAYLELFGTRASQTLAIYQHNHDHAHLPDGRVQHADGCVTHGHEKHSHEKHNHAAPNDDNTSTSAEKKK